MFSKRLVIGAAGLLALGAPAQAQLAAEATSELTPTTAQYTAARDSVLAKAAVYRSDNEASLRNFSASFTGIRGLRRKIVSYSSSHSGRVPLKVHTIKHKTTGTKIEKIEYRAQDGRLWLTERYVQDQLVRLELFEYTTTKYSSSGIRQSGTWLLVPGDYIQRTRKPDGKAKTSTFYFRTRPMPAE